MNVPKKYLTITVAILLIIAFEFSALGFSPIRETITGEEEEEELTPPEDALEGQKDFSFDLFFQLIESQDEDNIFISPYSIHTALHLAATGADGETRDEMDEVLRLQGEEVKEDASQLMEWLEDFSEKNEVSVANSMFLDEDIPFRESFVDDGEKYFDAKVDELPETGEPINDWVEENTEGKIEELIDPGPIDPLTIAYLVNAIHFEGAWEKEFDEEYTQKDIFHGEEEIEIEMMENRANYSYFEGEDHRAISLNYDNGDYRFNAFLPDRDSSLEEFYEQFDRNTYEENIDDMEKEDVMVRLPKFTLEEDYDLVESLKSIGIERAFEKYEANFSDMVELKDMDRNVYISEVSHSSFMEVDEKGTEAAGATGVGIGVDSVEPSYPVMEFDRPFFFTIEEPETETMIFKGHVEDPSE